MTYNPKEWRKLSERQRHAVIRKIEREEKRAKTVIVVVVCILGFAFLLFLFAIMSSCPTPQDETPTDQGNETQAQRKPGRACEPGCMSPLYSASLLPRYKREPQIGEFVYQTFAEVGAIDRR